MCSGEHSFTATGCVRHETYGEVAQWVTTAWEKVPESCIHSGFRKAELFTYAENPKEDMDSNDDAADIKAEQVPNCDLDLFHSDTEDKDFDGSTESDIEDAASRNLE